MDVSVPAPRAGEELSPTAADAAARPGGAAPAVEGGASAVAALYPVLFAAFPALSVAATSVGTYSVGDLLLVVAVSAAFGAAALAVGALAARLAGRDAALTRGAVLAFVAVTWMFYYIPFQEFVYALVRPSRVSRSVVLVPLLALPTAALLWLALRRRWTLGGGGRVLTLAGALLVVVASVRVARANAGARRRVLRSATWRQLSAPVPADPALARGPNRDVYLVVLDGYPNDAVLREKFGYDNAPFLDSLRVLGFTVPRHMRSNYARTILSIPSMLNFEHVTAMARDLSPNDPDHSLPTALTRDNRAARFLRARGYSYLLFPMQWFEPTRDSPLASYIYEAPRAALLAETQTTELRRVVLGSTLLSKVRAMRRGYGAPFILDEFRALREVPARPEPTFALAHFPFAHQPILFDAECRTRNSDRVVVGERLGLPGPRGPFLGSIQCANKQVLAFARDVLRRSPVAPIIIVVGDHGTLSRGWPVDAGLPPDSIAAERLAPLGAFYMPDGGGAMFRDSVTLVNVFRHVLRYYYGADLPAAPNDGYMNQAGEAFLFRPVDERVVLGG